MVEHVLDLTNAVIDPRFCQRFIWKEQTQFDRAGELVRPAIAGGETFRIFQSVAVGRLGRGELFRVIAENELHRANGILAKLPLLGLGEQSERGDDVVAVEQFIQPAHPAKGRVGVILGAEFCNDIAVEMSMHIGHELHRGALLCFLVIPDEPDQRGIGPPEIVRKSSLQRFRIVADSRHVRGIEKETWMGGYRLEGHVRPQRGRGEQKQKES